MRPVQHDSRGIVRPAELLQRVGFERHAPAPELARFVAWYWEITWDLPAGEPHTQHVVPHPVVNLTFQPEGSLVTGVQRRRQTQVLEGQGWVLGVMFRPAGFRPFLGAPLAGITDRQLAVGDLLGPALGIRSVAQLEADVRALGPGPAARARIDQALGARVPVGRQPSEDLTDLVERITGDRGLRRVEQLSAIAGVGDRQLQRWFRDAVGVSPTWVVRRARIHEVAERAARDEAVDWAGLAHDLGYSDQAHLTRDFVASFGVPPHRYREQCTRAEASAAR